MKISETILVATMMTVTTVAISDEMNQFIEDFNKATAKQDSTQDRICDFQEVMQANGAISIVKDCNPDEDK